MFKRLKRLFQLLSSEQRKRLIRLQFLVVLMAFAEGKINQYVRSNFSKKPSTDFNEQWQFLMADK